MDINNNTNIDEIVKSNKEVFSKIPNIEVQYSDGKPISKDLRKSTFEHDSEAMKISSDNSNSSVCEEKKVAYGGIIRGSLFEQSSLPGEIWNYEDVLDLNRFKADSMLEDKLELPISIKELYASTKQEQLSSFDDKEVKTLEFTLYDVKRLIKKMKKKI